jgi:hypothetical protein
MNKYLLLALGLPGISFLISALVAEGLPQPSTVAVPGLVITLLLAFNGLCVAAEFAIISIRPTQIEEMIEAGNKKAIDIMAILSSTAKHCHRSVRDYHCFSWVGDVWRIANCPLHRTLSGELAWY